MGARSLGSSGGLRTLGRSLLAGPQTRFELQHEAGVVGGGRGVVGGAVGDLGLIAGAYSGWKSTDPKSACAPLRLRRNPTRSSADAATHDTISMTLVNYR